MVAATSPAALADRLAAGDHWILEAGCSNGFRNRARRRRRRTEATESPQGALSRRHRARRRNTYQGVQGRPNHLRKTPGELIVASGDKKWVRLVIWLVVAMMVLTLMAALLPTLG
jgi:hypothetical protein